MITPDIRAELAAHPALRSVAGRIGFRALATIAHAVRGGIVLEALRTATGPDVGALRDAILHARLGSIALLTYRRHYESRADVAAHLLGWRHEDARSVPGTWIEGRLRRRAEAESYWMLAEQQAEEG